MALSIDPPEARHGAAARSARYIDKGSVICYRELDCTTALDTDALGDGYRRPDDLQSIRIECHRPQCATPHEHQVPRREHPTCRSREKHPAFACIEQQDVKLTGVGTVFTGREQHRAP